MSNTGLNTKVITGLVRFSYVQVWQPKINENGDAIYSVSIIIPKSDKTTIDEVNKAIENAAQIGLLKLGGKITSNLKKPLRDGDTDREDDEVYANSYFINATCRTQPGIVDRYRKQIMDSTEFYSGCYGHASINFYAFNSNGNKGIACGLNNLMKVKDGEPLGGRSKAEDDFKDIIYDEDIEEDLLN